MKYTKLSKEQFEELNEEFALFLAAQSIDVNEWTEIKKSKPELAEKQFEVFSDFVWEKVLSKAAYLDHFSDAALNLFKTGQDSIERLVVKVKKQGINLLKEQDFNWFLDNSNDPDIEYLKGQKGFSKERNVEVFELIQKGAVVSDGQLFEAVKKMLG